MFTAHCVQYMHSLNDKVKITTSKIEVAILAFQMASNKRLLIEKWKCSFTADLSNALQ